MRIHVRGFTLRVSSTVENILLKIDLNTVILSIITQDKNCSKIFAYFIVILMSLLVFRWDLVRFFFNNDSMHVC